MPSKGDRTPHRILVVEDHDDCREALVILLRLGGYEVDHAPTGPDAIHKAIAFQPHVAILDLDLPGMDGYATAEELRDSVANPPLLIATSGYAEQRERDRMAAAGFDAFLLKPLDVEDIEAILKVASERERA